MGLEEVFDFAVECRCDLHQDVHANRFVFAEFGEGVAADPCRFSELNFVHVLVDEDFPEFVVLDFHGRSFRSSARSREGP